MVLFCCPRDERYSRIPFAVLYIFSCIMATVTLRCLANYAKKIGDRNPIYANLGQATEYFYYTTYDDYNEVLLPLSKYCYISMGLGISGTLFMWRPLYYVARVLIFLAVVGQGVVFFAALYYTAWIYIGDNLQLIESRLRYLAFSVHSYEMEVFYHYPYYRSLFGPQQAFRCCGGISHEVTFWERVIEGTHVCEACCDGLVICKLNERFPNGCYFRYEYHMNREIGKQRWTFWILCYALCLNFIMALILYLSLHEYPTEENILLLKPKKKKKKGEEIKVQKIVLRDEPGPSNSKPHYRKSKTMKGKVIDVSVRREVYYSYK